MQRSRHRCSGVTVVFLVYLRLSEKCFYRLFAVAESDPNYRNPKKESVLIMAAEGKGFAESEHWYDHLEKHIGWKSLGKVLCGYVTQPGDTKGKSELKEAYELGKSI